MKFDVEIPALDGVARVEIRTVREDNGWASYIAFAAGHSVANACLMLGESGIPHRFTAPTETEAQEQAKTFLQNKYRVVRMVW